MLSNQLRAFLAANTLVEDLTITKADQKYLTSQRDEKTFTKICSLVTRYLHTGDKISVWMYAQLLKLGFTAPDDESWEAPPIGSALDLDWVTGYLETGSLDSIDPYKAYSSVLGTQPSSLGSLLNGSLAMDPKNLLVIEPMAGTAELSWYGHFMFPEAEFYLIDIDSTARDRVLARKWNTSPTYALNDVTNIGAWPADKSKHRLTFLGKQSQNFLSAPQLVAFMNCALDVEVPSTLIFELCKPCQYSGEEDGIIEFDCMTPSCLPNGLQIGMKLLSESPLVSRSALLALVAKDRSGATRTFFEYSWTLYDPQHLMMAAEMLAPGAYGTCMWYDWGTDQWVDRVDGVNVTVDTAYDEADIMWLRIENSLARQAREKAEALAAAAADVEN